MKHCWIWGKEKHFNHYCIFYQRLECMFLNNNFRFPDCMCADTLELKCPRNEYSFCFYAIFSKVKTFCFYWFCCHRAQMAAVDCENSSNYFCTNRWKYSNNIYCWINRENVIHLLLDFFLFTEHSENTIVATQMKWTLMSLFLYLQQNNGQ